VVSHVSGLLIIDFLVVQEDIGSRRRMETSLLMLEALYKLSTMDLLTFSRDPLKDINFMLLEIMK
jgi:hypothetical protein